jgi:4-amino-4-deoxy-L-arabinose transferase-like glycosyltransferase
LRGPWFDEASQIWRTVLTLRFGRSREPTSHSLRWTGRPGPRHHSRSSWRRLISAWTPTTTLVGLLVLACLLFDWHLGTPYMTMWDEAIQANVVQNLAEHCCVPRLHRSADVRAVERVESSDTALPQLQRTPNGGVDYWVGVDYRDWTNNTVWLHKPLLPFYVTAGGYRLLGESLWALRIPGAIFALLTALVVYGTGLKFCDARVALCASAIFALNPYTEHLVHGTAFSGFPDLAFVFFASVALYLILDWMETRSAGTLRWLGLVLGLGYLSKGGLAFAPFVVLGVVAIQTGGVRDLVHAWQSLVVFACVVLPQRLYWMMHYPVQLRYEEHLQFLHLFRVIEGHRGSWLAYLAFFLPLMLTSALVPLAYVGIGWGVIERRRSGPGFALAVWILAYVVPLSFAASKIENFVFATLPAIALLTPLAIERLMQSRAERWVASICLCSIAAAAFQFLTPGNEHRIAWMAVMVIALGGCCFAALSFVKVDLKVIATGGLVLTAAVLLWSDVRRDGQVATAVPPDSSEQAVLRETGRDLRPLVDPNGLVLLHRDPLAYLYLMYWSGVDVLDVCREPRPSATLARLRDAKDLYLIVDRQNGLPSHAALARLPVGTLFALKDIPFDLWSRVASGVCQGGS